VKLLTIPQATSHVDEINCSYIYGCGLIDHAKPNIKNVNRKMKKHNPIPQRAVALDFLVNNPSTPSASPMAGKIIKKNDGNSSDFNKREAFKPARATKETTKDSEPNSVGT